MGKNFEALLYRFLGMKQKNLDKFPRLRYHNSIAKEMEEHGQYGFPHGKAI